MFSFITFCAALLGATIFHLRLRQLRRRAAPACAAPPESSRVSIIVPARDEAHNLPTLLASLAQLTQPAGEIIVVDDESSDGTAQVARAHGVQVTRPEPRAAGFVGKPWACLTGASVARGDFLLFTDADTAHAPDSLARALSRAAQQDAALVSIVPSHCCERLWERLQGVFQLLLLIATRAGAGRDSRYANGQYLLFRRDAYEALGGHRAVAAHIAEDLAFVTLLRERGLRSEVLFAPHALRVRMYPEGFGQFVAGWRRNFREGMRGTGLAIGLEMTAVMAWLIGSPLCLALALLQQRADWPLWAAVVLLSAWCIGREQRHHGDFGWASALLYPLFALVFAAISLLSGLDALRGTPIMWRGRRIEAARRA